MKRVLSVLVVVALMGAVLGGTAISAGAQVDTDCGDYTYRTYTFADGVWYQWYRWCFDPNMGWHTDFWGWDGPY